MVSSVSLVIPIFNEQETIAALGKALLSLKTQLPKKTEVIFVDDGSTDHTLIELKKLRLPYRKIIITFSRNFGHQSALFAGLAKSKYDYIVSMDGDLQHPIQLIPKMLQQHQLGYDVVLTKRIDTEYIPPFKKLTAQLFYTFINWLSPTDIPINSSDFRSLSRRALTALLTMPEKQKFLRGMVSWIGFSSVVLPFEVEPRFAGKSKYSLLKMITLALHGLTTFSVMPLYLSGIFSLILFALTIAYAIYVLYAKFFTNAVVSGWASVLLVLLLLGGFITLFLGMIGAYLAALYEEVKNRPLYIVKEEHEETQ